jgi:prolyl-tRNA editing enzyme YbaK/EbsC (Cys-tRNA(Pro) deacylase)
VTSSHPAHGPGAPEGALARTAAQLRAHAPEQRIIELDGSHPSIEQAAATIGVAVGQVAKALLVEADPSCVLIVIPGDARLDNRKFRARFGARLRLVPAAETERLTGHPIGGVGPFGHAPTIPVFCDRRLLDFALVYPAAGTRTRVVELTPMRLAALADAPWVDVCQ